MAPPILYIHPFGYPSGNVIPIGVLTCMNSLVCEKLGLYQHEVTKEHIQNARVAALSLHWYFPLEAVQGYSTFLKGVNPDLTVVVGGVTASLYPDMILRNSGVDFIVTGDAEVPFQELVEGVLAGKKTEDLAGIPNVWSRWGAPQERFFHDNSSFARLDFLTHDWFPSYASYLRVVHDTFRAAGSRYTDNFFPYLPLHRGCSMNCFFCYGNHQKFVYGRAPLVRSAEKLNQELDWLEREGYAFVNLVHDSEWGPVWKEHPFQRKYQLQATIYLCLLPELEELEHLLESFEFLQFFVVHPEDDFPFNRVRQGTERGEKLLAAFDALTHRNFQVLLFRVDQDHRGPSEFDRRLGAKPRPWLETIEGYEWSLPLPHRERLDALGIGAQYQQFRDYSREFQHYQAAVRLSTRHDQLLNHWSTFREFKHPPMEVRPEAAPLQEALQRRYRERFVPGLADVRLTLHAGEVECDDRIPPGAWTFPMRFNALVPEFGGKLKGGRQGESFILGLAIFPEHHDLAASALWEPLLQIPVSGTLHEIKASLGVFHLQVEIRYDGGVWTHDLPLHRGPLREDVAVVGVDAASPLWRLFKWLAPALEQELAFTSLRAKFQGDSLLLVPEDEAKGDFDFEITPRSGQQHFLHTGSFNISYRDRQGGDQMPKDIEVIAALVRRWESEEGAVGLPKPL